jgi:RiboL-PSP-HEPN
MPSQARKSLHANLEDIRRLLELHSLVGGKGVGRRHRLEVLNKSAIVLITAYWEAYCEDIAAEALAHIVKNAKSSAALPNELKKLLAKELKAGLNELEVWKIADSGWKKYLGDRLDLLKERRNWDLNTPKTDQIDKLFLHALGIEKISNSWGWKGMAVAQSSRKLDKYVALRGAIAHRGKGSATVKKSHVSDYFDFVQNLAGRTGGAVNKHVKAITNKRLWN